MSCKTAGEYLSHAGVLAALQNECDTSISFSYLQRALEALSTFRNIPDYEVNMVFSIDGEGRIRVPYFVKDILAAKLCDSQVRVSGRFYEYTQEFLGSGSCLKPNITFIGDESNLTSFGPSAFCIVPEADEYDTYGQPKSIRIVAVNQSGRRLLAKNEQGTLSPNIVLPMVVSDLVVWEDPTAYAFQSVRKDPTNLPVSIFKYDSVAQEIGELILFLEPEQTTPCNRIYCLRGVKCGGGCLSMRVTRKIGSIHYAEQPLPDISSEVVADMIRYLQNKDVGELADAEQYLSSALKMFDYSLPVTEDDNQVRVKGLGQLYKSRV